MTDKKKHHVTSIDHIWKDIPRLDLSKVQPAKWLIDLFLAQGSIQLVYGSYGTRKTTAMLLAAWCVSQGIPFLGRKTRKRAVLYIDYENPADVVKTYCKDLGIDPTASRFTIWDRAQAPPPVPGDPGDKAPNGDGTPEKDKLGSFIARCHRVTDRFPWIVLDSFTSLLKSDASGNQINDAAPIFRAIRNYRDLGATFTIIDHTGKDKHSKQPIGTSAKLTQMDSAHLFSEYKQETDLFDADSSRTVIRVESFLKRYAPAGVGTFSFQTLSGTDETGAWHLKSLEAAKDIEELKLEEQIDIAKRVIRHNPTKGTEELTNIIVKEGKKLKLSRDRVRQLLHEGAGRHWEIISQGKRKKVFHVLAAPKISENPNKHADKS